MEKETEKITVGEAITWWTKNRQWVIPIVVGVFAALGGNADRLDEWLPALGGNTELVAKVEKLETTVNTLVKVVGAHENKLFPQGQPVENDPPAFRE